MRGTHGKGRVDIRGKGDRGEGDFQERRMKTKGPHWLDLADRGCKLGVLGPVSGNHNISRVSSKRAFDLPC